MTGEETLIGMLMLVILIGMTAIFGYLNQKDMEDMIHHMYDRDDEDEDEDDRRNI